MQCSVAAETTSSGPVAPSALQRVHARVSNMLRGCDSGYSGSHSLASEHAIYKCGNFVNLSLALKIHDFCDENGFAVLIGSSCEATPNDSSTVVLMRVLSQSQANLAASKKRGREDETRPVRALSRQDLQTRIDRYKHTADHTLRQSIGVTSETDLGTHATLAVRCMAGFMALQEHEPFAQRAIGTVVLQASSNAAAASRPSDAATPKKEVFDAPPLVVAIRLCAGTAFRVEWLRRWTTPSTLRDGVFAVSSEKFRTALTLPASQPDVVADALGLHGCTLLLGFPHSTQTPAANERAALQSELWPTKPDSDRLPTNVQTEQTPFIDRMRKFLRRRLG